MAIDYKKMTIEWLIESCLQYVTAKVDKREGSLIWWAVGAACAKLAEFYSLLSTEMDRAFPDTAQGIDLTNKAKERGIFRLPATCAVRRGQFEGEGGAPFAVPIGARFSGGDANYKVTKEEKAGVFLLTAEEPGELGNVYSGNLIPIEYISGLTAATVTDIVIPGEEEESDEVLYTRYEASFHTEAFGGNIADYKEKVKKMPGVGYVKIFPVWQGGGTVGIVLTDSTGAAPDPALIETIQTAVDPQVNQGLGLGTAPIGHIATVMGATAKPIAVAFALTLADGQTWAAVEPKVELEIKRYLGELTGKWEEVTALKMDAPGLVVRISQIESRLIEIEGIVDITGTTINGVAENMTLSAVEIPVLGGVTNAA